MARGSAQIFHVYYLSFRIYFHVSFKLWVCGRLYLKLGPGFVSILVPPLLGLSIYMVSFIFLYSTYKYHLSWTSCLYISFMLKIVCIYTCVNSWWASILYGPRRKLSVSLLRISHTKLNVSSDDSFVFRNDKSFAYHFYRSTQRAQIMFGKLQL